MDMLKKSDSVKGSFVFLQDDDDAENFQAFRCELYNEWRNQHL